MSNEEIVISFEEAMTFARDVLLISSPDDKLKSDREAFLQEFILAWFHHIPFQSIKAISVPSEDRHKPTFAEIKQDVLSRLGGLCYDQNVCCYAVLRAFGYDVYLAACDISLASDHAIVIVRNLTSTGSIHMVDVGVGNPTFHAIPFDFEHESPEYHDSYLRYKFIRKDDIIIRQHPVETIPKAVLQLHPDRAQDGWYPFIVIDYSHPRDITHFHDVMTKIYSTQLPSPPFLRSPICMTWPDGRFVCINETTLLVENEGGHVEKSYFNSLEELVEAFGRYFPQFSETMVKAALTDVNVHLDFDKS